MDARIVMGHVPEGNSQASIVECVISTQDASMLEKRPCEVWQSPKQFSSERSPIRSESSLQSKKCYCSLHRMHRSVSLFCATLEFSLQWNDGSSSRIILLFKDVRLIELSRLEEDLVIKGKLLSKNLAMTCFVDSARPYVMYSLHHFGLAPLSEDCAVPPLTHWDGAVMECVQTSLRRFKDRLSIKSDKETRTSNVQKRLIWLARFQTVSKFFW